MSAVDLAEHLANALASYTRRLRRNGRGVPPELAAFAAAFLSGAARSGLERPEFGEGDEDGHASGMALVLDYDEVGQLLGVSDRTVRRLVHDGELRAVRIGSSVRIRPTDLAEYVNELPVSREDKQ